MASASYSGVSAQIPFVLQAVMDYAKETFFMPNLVTVHTDMMGMNPRAFSQFPSSGTVFNGLAEATDLTAQGFDYTALGTITPKEVAYRIDITDQRATTDGSLSIDALGAIAQEFAYKVMKQPEVDLISYFSSFTGGTIWAGSAANTAGTLNWGNLYAARATLEKAKIPGPYYCVVDNYHYHYLATAANVAGLTNAAPLNIRNDIQSNYLVTQVTNDMFLYTSPNCGTNSSTQIFMGVFARPSLHLDVRRGLRVAPQRDESARLLELNATMWYGSGIIRPTFGVTIKGTVISSVNN